MFLKKNKNSYYQQWVTAARMSFKKALNLGRPFEIEHTKMLTNFDLEGFWEGAQESA
jgi:hypothetical protein